MIPLTFLERLSLPNLAKMRRLIRTAYEVKEVYGTTKSVVTYVKEYSRNRKLYTLVLHEDHFCYDLMWNWIKSQATKVSLDDVKKIRAVHNPVTDITSIAFQLPVR